MFSYERYWRCCCLLLRAKITRLLPRGVNMGQAPPRLDTMLSTIQYRRLRPERKNATLSTGACLFTRVSKRKRYLMPISSSRLVVFHRPASITSPARASARAIVLSRSGLSIQQLFEKRDDAQLSRQPTTCHYYAHGLRPCAAKSSHAAMSKRKHVSRARAPGEEEVAHGSMPMLKVDALFSSTCTPDGAKRQQPIHGSLSHA